MLPPWTLSQVNHYRCWMADTHSLYPLFLTHLIVYVQYGRSLSLITLFQYRF